MNKAIEPEQDLKKSSQPVANTKTTQQAPQSAEDEGTKGTCPSVGSLQASGLLY